jgi:hypothetical protein
MQNRIIKEDENKTTMNSNGFVILKEPINISTPKIRKKIDNTSTETFLTSNSIKPCPVLFIAF